MSEVVFISEVSSNHFQDLERCLQFIDCSADIGCHAVKFQLFRIQELFAADILKKSKTHNLRKKWELPLSFLPVLQEKCKKRRIAFGCTPFYLDAVEELVDYVDFFKIASYELLWDDLLRQCAKTGKPIVMSTGMATMAEVRHAVKIVAQEYNRENILAHKYDNASARQYNTGSLNTSLVLPQIINLLHCVSTYPSPCEESNLMAIKTMRDAFDTISEGEVLCCPHVSVGWSDHSVRNEVIQRAVKRWHAEIIEFHLDLDGKGEEYGSGHCWLPQDIAEVIREIHIKNDNIQESQIGHIPMDGNGIKVPAKCEFSERNWRADPSDGLRPMLSIREAWVNSIDNV